MSGHRSFAELTKELTAEDWQRVAKKRAELDEVSLFHMSATDKERTPKAKTRKPEWHGYTPTRHSTPTGSWRNKWRDSIAPISMRRDINKRAVPGIESTPGVCGGEPRVARTRITVWILEQATRLGTGEAELLQAYPALRAEDLTNAWAYVLSHRQEIEEQIRANEDA